MSKKIWWLSVTIIVFLAGFLRFYQLSFNPPSPYWEEAAIGYDAYSILKTGKDFHGNTYPLIAFESFGDYKPSLYFYATAVSVAIFGLNSLAVRIPSALSGTLTVLLLMLLVQKIRPRQELTALVTGFFLAIIPWHLLVSRVGFEANLGLLLVTAGAYFFILGRKQKRSFWWWPAALSLVLSMYAYHANRVLAPLLALSWLIINRQQVVKRWRLSLAVGGLSLLLLWPLTARLNTAQVRQRFNETSVFSDLTPIINSNELIAADGSGLGAKLLHHRYWQYLSLFADHYLDQFTVSFLFLSGDTNPRHSTQTSGQLYLTLLPLMLLGAYYLWYSRRSDFYWFTSWLLLAPIPAALTRATPHALRSLALVIPLVVLAAIGLVRLFYFKRLWAVIALLLVSFEFTRFWVNYQGSYRTRFSDQWQYGYQQLVELINQHYGSYDNIYVTRTVGRPSIYYWFYSATEPLKVQVINNTVSKDQGEYLEFAKIKFTQPPSITTGSSLIVSTSDQMGFGELLTIITDLSGKKVFYVYEKN